LDLLRKLGRFLIEAGSFYSFFRRTEKSRRDIVFYAEDTASYGYFEGLVEYLINTEGLKIAYVTSDPSDPLLRLKQNRNISTFYIKSLLPFFTVILDSRLLIMTMPDLHRFHVRRSERGTHHVYMFHNIGSSFPVIRYGALFHYDTVFCVGPHHKEEIRRQEELYSLPEKNLVAFGYYRLEKIFDAFKGHVRKDTKYRARVLIGPTWGENSILNVCGTELVRNLLEAGYEVVVRPHPMTRLTDPSLLDGLNAEFGGCDNYVFEEDISLLDSLFNADVLVSDWSGFMYEYAFGTERPVLFIDVPRKVVNERWEEVGIEPVETGIRKRIGTVLGADELAGAARAVEGLIEGREEYVREISKARDELVYNFKSSSRAGAEFIKGYLDKT